MTDIPHTSTPLKLAHHFLQKASDGNFMVQKSFQDNNSKGTRFLGAKAVTILNKWFIENRDYPYPDEATTDLLAREADISAKQVKKWFANKRVRSQLCCKPMHRRKRSSNGAISSNLSENGNMKSTKHEGRQQFKNEHTNHHLYNQFMPSSMSSSTTFNHLKPESAANGFNQKHPNQAYFPTLKIPSQSSTSSTSASSSLLQPCLPLSLLNKPSNVPYPQPHIPNQFSDFFNNLPFIKSMSTSSIAPSSNPLQYNPLALMNLLATQHNQNINNRLANHHHSVNNLNLINRNGLPTIFPNNSFNNSINNVMKSTSSGNSNTNSTSSAISNSSSNSNEYIDEDINENSNENSLSYENDNLDSNDGFVDSNRRHKLNKNENQHDEISMEEQEDEIEVESDELNEKNHKEQLYQDDDDEDDVGEEDNDVDEDQSNELEQQEKIKNNNSNNNNNNNKNNQFLSMLMMLNSNYNRHQLNGESKNNNSNSNNCTIDENISSVTPPPSGSSGYATNSASALPFISSSSSSSSSSSASSSSSRSSSSNNSKNNTPNINTNSNLTKLVSPSSFIKQEFLIENIKNTNNNKTIRKSYEKKINFAIISTLID